MAAICGIDWAADFHDVHVADAHGRVLARERFSHDEPGIEALIGLLLAHRVARVAIERPDGLLVGRLLAAGLTVLAIHPNQVAAARDRFRAAAGKSGRFDAMVLCELGRTDHHRFPALAPSTDETLALRALVRTREDLVVARVALANQLRAHLDAFWPGAKQIFADIDSPIALAFLARYPSPADVRGLGPKRLAAFLARHAYCGRKTPEALLARLRQAPIAVTGELETEARRTAVQGLVCALRPLVEQISQVTSEIRGAIHRHPDGPILRSLFRDPKSVVCAAGLLAEIGDNRPRYPTDDSLAADGGQAPVTKQSGKHRAVSFRWACDKRLRNHLGVLADSTRHWHPWAHDIYQRAIDRGCDHPHATPHPRPRLDPHPVALLAGRHALQPHPTPSAHAPPRAPGLTQDVSCRPDVVGMDLNMPGRGGIEATRRILETTEGVHVLVMTMHEEDEAVFAALRAGALGYQLKGAVQAETLRAIRAVANGEAILGPAIGERLQRYLAPQPATDPAEAFPQLTERELEVLQLLAERRTNAEIAAKLFLSQKTVRNYVSGILDKLQVTDRAEARLVARAAGIGSGDTCE